MMHQLRRLPAVLARPRLSGRRPGVAATLATLAALATLALPALAPPPASATAASAKATGFRIRLHIANHTPVAGRHWPVELTVTRGRRKLTGTVRYQFIFAGGVVRTQPRHGAFRFRHGVYRDQLVFPKQSRGERLTLRFLVRTRYGREHADWALEIRR